MTAAQGHTPGPWTAKKYGQYGEWQVEAGDRQLIIAPRIGGQRGSDDANARLIASARALLAALEAFTEQYQKLAGFPNIIGPFVGPYVAAKSAVEKARG